MGLMSAEYTEALNTLSDTTMKKALDLLMTGTDPTIAVAEQGTNPTTELCRLLESCKTASKVILSETQQQHAQPALNLPAGSLMMATGGAMPPASRIAPRGAGGIGVGHATVTTKKNLLPPPNRRMSGLPRLGNSISTKRIKMEQQRPKCESSAFKVAMKQQPEGAATTTTTATAENKQPNTSSSSGPLPSLSSPPPSAMQFLARLNKSTAADAATSDNDTNNNKTKKAKPPKAPRKAAKIASESSAPVPLSSVDDDEADEQEGDEEEHDEEEDEMELDDEEEEEEEEHEEEEEAEVKPRRSGRPRRPSLQTATTAATAPSRRQPSRSSKR
jgi:hypothetical protein